MLRLYYEELDRLDHRAALAAAFGMGLRKFQEILDPDLTTPLMVFLLEDLE